LSESLTGASFKRVEKIPLSCIDMIEWLQPRDDIGNLVELARSLKFKGDVDVPLKVRPDGRGRYELIWGYRRLTAAKLAGLERISCIVEEVDDEEVLRQCAVENLFRLKKNPIEEGEFFHLWSRRTGKKYDQIACELGLKAKYIYNRVELLKLSPAVIEKYKKLPTDRKPGILSLLYLLRVKDPNIQLKLFNELVEGDMTVKELRKRLEQVLQDNAAVHDYVNILRSSFYDLTVPLTIEDLKASYHWLISESFTKLFTHFDTPSLFVKDGKTIDQYLPSWFIGRCAILDVRCSTGEDVITADRVKQILEGHYLPNGTMVFLCTGWARYRGLDSYLRHPVIDESLAEWLVKKKVKILGVDMPDIERGGSKAIHRTLLSNDVLILENVGDMSQIVGKNVFMYALPINIKAGTAVPARVIARTRKRRAVRQRKDEDSLYKDVQTLIA
jgi:ParB/RepB/Spo0J family partition protein